MRSPSIDPSDTEHVDIEHLERAGARQAAKLRRAAGGVHAGQAPLELRRRPQAVEDAAMLGDIAGGEHVGMRGAELVVNDKALVHRQAGLARQVTARPHAGGDNDEIDRGTPSAVNLLAACRRTAGQWRPRPLDPDRGQSAQ